MANICTHEENLRSMLSFGGLDKSKNLAIITLKERQLVLMTEYLKSGLCLQYSTLAKKHNMSREAVRRSIVLGFKRMAKKHVFLTALGKVEKMKNKQPR